MSLSFLLHDNQDSSVWMVLIASSFQCMSTVSNDMGGYLYSVYVYYEYVIQNKIQCLVNYMHY